MSDDSWYRRVTWTGDDQSAFFARLRRSRGGFNKAQYCRIQAVCLQEAGNYQAALDLLDLIMAEWPEEAQEAPIYHQMAECHSELGDPAAALVAYHRVFDAQRRKPGYKTTAHLGFGLLVALTPYPELFDEAATVLNEFCSSSGFPVEEFKYATVLALIADAKGDFEQAARQAKNALAASARTHSGYARHAKLGLVANVDHELKKRLERIAERSR